MAPGSVEYLLHGCDSRVDPAPAQDLDGAEPGPGSENPEGQRSALGTTSTSAGAAGYLQAGVHAGEPDGVWLGNGMAGLGLSIRAGDTATAGDVRALFGQLRYPTSQMPESTDKNPVYLGSKPRRFRTAAELVEDALKREPTQVTVERHQEIEQTAKKNARRPTAYYDVTFSPVKSVSLMYAALLSAADIEGANAIRDAHNEAIRIAIASVENDLAYVRTGRHEGRGPSGRTVGRWERATGLMVVVYAHHTNRDGEPQLHTHAALSARAATPDGRIYAIDGYGFHAIKDALATAYTRAYQQLTTERLGYVYQQRDNGAAREIAGVSPILLAEGSSRTLDKVRPLVADLVEAYTDRHGHEPGPRARRALVEQAVKDTRRPKSGMAGPGAVAAWATCEPGRQERLAAALDAAERAGVAAIVDGDLPRRNGVNPEGAPALSGRDIARAVVILIEANRSGSNVPNARGSAAFSTRTTPGSLTVERGGGDRNAMAGLVAMAIDRGIGDVQTKYATWNIGNLTRAIDEHLGDHAGALGIPPAERPAFLSTIAGHVLEQPERFGIVQVSTGDPVPVPDVLRRNGPGEDRRPMFRAHIDERYATTTHLTAERRLLASIHTTGSVRANADQMAVVRQQLDQSSLSDDQMAAICGVLSSGRAADVIVGPAGTGKSHTMGVLAVEWNAVTGGRVLGVASAEIAARNLDGLGMDARNVRRFLNDFATDPATGLVHDRLGPQDLIVVDEAGMTPTTDLVAIADLAGAAGAKIVYVGDHHQLQPVGAGGIFAYLADQPDVFELATVHRFTEGWEADASLMLRSGDPSAAIEYANRGRLVCGTIDEITAMAVRGHVADVLDGRTALLIVSSNALATELSQQVHDELVARGRVASEPLVYLPDATAVAVGDLVQTRLNDTRLYVAPGPDGSALSVTNKEVYTVVGRRGDGTLLARDQRGAIAHLPGWYVREYLTLAYAVTAHAAQGVTVDVGRGVLSLDATREQAYVPASRGRERNLLYLQTEHHPDTHETQRVQETPIQRLADILTRSGIDEAALTALDTARSDVSSMSHLGALYAGVSELHAHTDNAQMLSEILGPEHGETIQHDPALGALLGAVYAAQLDGHDPRALLTEAAQMRAFDGARSVAQVLHWRIGVRLTERAPEARGAADGAERDWGAVARVLPEGHPVRDYLLEIGAQIEQRQAELGSQVAVDPPVWAQQRLPAVPPTTDLAARAAWERRAGIAAAYREYRGIPEAQVSLGEPPPPAQQFARAMWLAAVEQLDDDPVTRRWSQASDAELRQAREVWQRTVRDADQHGPHSVADEMASTYRLAAEIRDDAILTRTDADGLPAADTRRAELLERAERYGELAARYLADARALEHDYIARQLWWDRVAPLREADQAAAAELERRDVSAPAPQHLDSDGGHPPGGGRSEPGVQPEQPRSDTSLVDSSVQDIEHHTIVPQSAGPQRNVSDGVHSVRSAGQRWSLRPAGDESHHVFRPEADQKRRAAREEADERAVEADRRGQTVYAAAPDYLRTEQRNETTVRGHHANAEQGSEYGPDYGAADGYGWD